MLRPRLAWALLGSLLLAASARAAFDASNPVLFDGATFGATSPKGIAYHPIRDTLFIVDGSGMLIEITRAGVLVASFSTAAYAPIPKGIAYDPVSGDLLICDGTAVYRVTVGGVLVPPSPFLDVSTLVVDADGLAVSPGSGTLWIADGNAEEIVEVSRSGIRLGSFSTTALKPAFDEPEGISFLGSDLLVADNSGGTQTVYILSTGGLLRQELLETTPDLTDPEGVTSVADGAQMCVAGAGDNAVLCVDLIGMAPVPAVGAPGIALLALLLGLTGARRARWPATRTAARTGR